MKNLQVAFLFAVGATAMPLSGPIGDVVQVPDLAETNPSILPRFIRDNQKGNVKQAQMMVNLCETRLRELRNVTGSTPRVKREDPKLQFNLLDHHLDDLGRKIDTKFQKLNHWLDRNIDWLEKQFDKMESVIGPPKADGTGRETTESLQKRGNWHEDDDRIAECHKNMKKELIASGLFGYKPSDMPSLAARDQENIPSAIRKWWTDAEKKQESSPSDSPAEHPLSKRFVCTEENRRIRRAEEEMHFYSDIISHAISSQKHSPTNAGTTQLIVRAIDEHIPSLAVADNEMSGSEQEGEDSTSDLSKRFICTEENRKIRRGEEEMNFYSDLLSHAIMSLQKQHAAAVV